MKTIFISILALLLSLAPAAFSQKPASSIKNLPASAYNLIAVKVTGTARYSDKEILPASGLALGQKVGDEDFKAAVHHLGDSGMFSGAAYSFSYSPAGTKLELQLTDADDSKLVPAHFENFVWFIDADLLRDLQQRVPLFKGTLPVTGNLIDHVSEALQTILDEKQIKGRVDYLREAKPDGGDLTGVAYRVLDMAIRIRNAEFPGATPDQAPPLLRAARKLAGADYVRSSLTVVARLDFLPVYLERGYLKASFAPSDARVITPNADNTPADTSDVQVDAIFPVTPGKVYSTSEVVWEGNGVFPSEQLQALLHLPAAQPANAVRLEADLENVTKLYRSHGYMMARVAPDPVIDEEHSTVHYTLNIVEGEQFKMAELELQGLDVPSEARLREAWNLREGEPYNADYVKIFLDDSARLLPKGARWGSTVHVAVNEKDKTVDVTIRFSAN